MQTVGVDFGTTNVRIATWDSTQPGLLPQTQRIGQGDASTMPAVIAFQRRPRGATSTIVGEDADALADDSDTIVVRNIKRWALASDPFVKWHLESSKVSPPSWWDPESRCVQVWGQQIPVSEVMRIILAEAIQRAGLNGDFQWRAGCPVQAGLDYRSELARILSTFGGEEKVTSVVEEPVLFLSLAHRLNALSPGSYLVYDLGGGSFDCAIAQVTAEGRMTVYASHGDPRLGGSTIDADLAQALDYRGLSHSLRIAKEQLSPTHTSESIDGNVNLSWNDLVKVLDKRKFFGWTCEAMRLAYISAKVIWKPDAGSSPISRIPSLRLGHMAEAFGKDIDAIILFGGSTKSPYFRDRLTETFGINKVITPDELIPAEIPDPELTGLSIGACYSADGGYPPLYVNRLPARVTLRDTSTGDQVGYEPYQHFVPNFSPARPFVSHRLPRRTGHRAKWELAVADADENVLESKLVDPGYQRTSSDPISSPALVIDTLGRI